jgi:hypothetical protein
MPRGLCFLGEAFSAFAESRRKNECRLTFVRHPVYGFQRSLKRRLAMKDVEIQEKAADAIRACLGEVPFIRVKRVRKNQRQKNVEADFLLDLQMAGGPALQIVVEVKTNGQPRLARDAVNQLLRCSRAFPMAYGVFMAPYISPQSADICEKEGIGYLDLAGNCRISFGQVFIRREGLRNPFAQKRDLRSLYAPKSARILRVLLMCPSEGWKTQALADEARVSLGQVANVKKLLRDREWVADGKAGFKLTDPMSLLADWAGNYTYRKNTARDFYAMKGPDEAEAALAKACRELEIPYAFTGFSAARRVAPAVRGQRTMAYVGAISEALLERAGLKEVPSGANVSLMVPYDEGVFYGAREVEGLRVVCPIQLYLDLQGYKGRGEEAAGAVLKQELSKLW